MADLTTHPDVFRQMVDFMRDNGIRRLRVGGDEIELFSAAPEAEKPDAPRPEVTTAADVCNCGHDADCHMSGRCIEGCDDEQCAKKRT